jgi:hypothetical protein
MQPAFARHDLLPPSATMGERVGEVLGRLAGPVFAATSTARRARTFHPRGDCLDAIVERAANLPSEWTSLAARLEGAAFVRFADALTKKKARWPDVLGCAIRFGDVAPVDDGDQDLLFATIKRPWTMPFSPFTTKVSDWLANDYFAVCPFEVDGTRVYFRLRPRMRGAEDVGRGEHGAARRRASLGQAISVGAASIQLEVGRGPRGPFVPIVDIHLTALWSVDPPDLHFDPFRDGRRIVPRGFVHALRRGVYAASQRARDRVWVSEPRGPLTA